MAEITDDQLKADKNFIRDANSFLFKRTGKQYGTAEEVFDAWAEHMRFHDTNEVTAVRDFNYAQDADEEDKQEFAKLLTVWDQKQGSDFTDAVGDYIQAGITAPSTWLSIITGGAGKVAGLAGKQAAQVGLRTILNESLKSAAKGAVVEGAIGLGTGAAQEATRVETGAQEEFTGERTLISGLAQGIGGALPAGIAGGYQTAMAKKAVAKEQAGREISSARAEDAKKAVEKTLAKSKAKVKKAEEEILSDDIKNARASLEKLNTPRKKPLPKEEVEEGLKLLRKLSGTEQAIVELPRDTLRSITAAAIELGEKLKVKKDQRITSAIRTAISEGQISTKEVDDILAKYNISYDEFSLMHQAEMSEAGRKLAEMSAVARKTKSKDAIEKVEAQEKIVKRLATNITDYLNETGVSGITPSQLREITRRADDDGKILGFFKGADRLRLSMMTSQLATTARNFAGGGYRVAADAIDTTFENIYRTGQLGLSKVGLASEPVKTGIDNPFAVLNNLTWNQAEAKVVRGMFEEAMPQEAAKFYGTFMETAIASSKMGGQSKVTKLGAWFNTLNRVSDNTYKQAIFAGKLDQAVRRDMPKYVNGKRVDRSLMDVIADGDFKKIDKNTFKEAIEESLDMVYQKTPSGNTAVAKLGRGIISAHREAPFVISTFLPFPRFVINQLDFVSDHTPLIGLIGTKLKGEKIMDPKTLAKQTSGATMLAVAYAFRSVQDPNETEWFEATDEKGNTIDLRPFAGPMNAFLLAADMMWRYRNDKELKKPTGILKDGFQALGGPSMRAGTGLYTLDKLFTDLGDTKVQRVSAKVLGDLVNTYTLPASVIRDVVSIVDEEGRNVPITDYDNALDVFVANATKSLPNMKFVNPDLELSISERVGSEEIQVGAERPDIFAGQPLKSVDPFERQLFGLGKRAPKNDFQKTLTRLQMSTYDLYKPGDYPYENRLLQEAGGRVLARKMNSYVNSEAFQQAEPKMQKQFLKERFGSELTKLREQVRERIQTEERGKAQAGESTRVDRMDFEQLDSDTKANLIEQYEKQYGEWDDNYARALQLLPKVKARVKRQGMAVGGSVEDEEETSLLETAGEIALGFVPVVGDIIDAKDFYSAVKDEDYIGAAISAVGFVPIVGNGLKKGLQATRELYEAADPLIKNRAMKEFVDQEGRVPDLEDAEDIAIITEKAAQQEKVVAGINAKDKGRDMPLFHGSRAGTSLDPEKMLKHKELGAEALSTSRDPLYSLDTFAKMDEDKMYVVRPKTGSTVDMTPREYDIARGRARETSEGVDIPSGSIESKLPAQLPKSMYTEAETIIQDLGDVEVSKLADNPKLLEKVRRGAEALADYKKSMFGSDDIDDLTNVDYNIEIPEGVARKLDIDDTVVSGLDGLGDLILQVGGDRTLANLYYDKFSKAMKKAQGLGAYTSGAGARGTYDRILNDMARVGSEDANDVVDDFEYLEETLDTVIEHLVDDAGNLTQRGEKLAEFQEALFDIKRAQDYATAQDSAANYKEVKDRIMDITNKMNRGGLASRK